jgi:hypothetical protein
MASVASLPIDGLRQDAAHGAPAVFAVDGIEAQPDRDQGDEEAEDRGE